MKRVSLSLVFLLLSLAALLDACQSPASTPFQEVVIVTQVISPPEITPSPTPACTALSPGMSLEVTPNLHHSLHIAMNGLVPDEKVTVTVYSGDIQSASWQDMPDVPVQPDGTLSLNPGLPVEPSPHWLIRVVHSRGVACAEGNYP